MRHTHSEDNIEFIFNMTVKQGMKAHGQAAIDAIRKEVTGILNKETFQPVHAYQIKEGSAVIPSKMFLKAQMAHSKG